MATTAPFPELGFDPFKTNDDLSIDDLPELSRPKLQAFLERYSELDIPAAMYAKHGREETNRRYIAGVKAKIRRDSARRIERFNQIKTHMRLTGSSVKETLTYFGASTNWLYLTFRDYPQLRDGWMKAKAEARAIRMERIGANVPMKDRSFSAKRKYYFNTDTYWWQEKIVDIIEKAPEGEISLILLPPSTGKTMTIEDWLAITIGEDPSTRVLYISETDMLPEKVIAKMMARMEDPEEAPNYFKLGPFRPESAQKKWSRFAIEVFKKPAELRDYNIQAKGWFSQIHSMRADVIIVDDMQTGKSINRTAEMVRVFQDTIINRLEGLIHGKIIILGHRLDLDDFYGVMIEDQMIEPENIFVFPLSTMVDESTEVSNFKPIISDRAVALTRKRMKKRYEAVMQQNPAGMESYTFSDVIKTLELEGKHFKYLKGGDLERTVRHPLPEKFDTSLVLPNGETIKAGGRIISVDPAFSGGNSTIALAWNMREMRLMWLDYQFNMRTPAAIEAVVESMSLRVDPDLVIIEAKAAQAGIVRSESMKGLALKYGFRLVEHQTGENKFDPVLGVPQMETLMNMGGIIMPIGDRYSLEMWKPLMDQLTKWRPDVPTKSLVQDTIMSLWFAYWYVMLQRRIIAKNVDELKSARVHQHRARAGSSHSRLPWAPTRL